MEAVLLLLLLLLLMVLLLLLLLMVEVVVLLLLLLLLLSLRMMLPRKTKSRRHALRMRTMVVGGRKVGSDESAAQRRVHERHVVAAVDNSTCRKRFYLRVREFLSRTHVLLVAVLTPLALPPPLPTAFSSTAGKHGNAPGWEGHTLPILSSLPARAPRQVIHTYSAPSA